VWVFLVTIPFWTNLLIRTFAMQQVIRNEGVLNTVLIWSGIIDQPVQIMYTDTAILFGMVYVYLPLMVLPLYASMEKLDFRLVEAGYDLYATRLRCCGASSSRWSSPGIVAGSILVFIPSLGAYVIPRVLGGGKNMMLGNLIELQFGPGRNWPLGAALSITLMAVVMLALLVYVRNATKEERAAWLEGRPSTCAASPASPPSRSSPSSLLYLPIARWSSMRSTPANSIAYGKASRCAGSSAGTTTGAGRRMRSLVIAVCAALIATIAATMAALATTRTKPYPGLTFKYAFINQPLMVPEIVTAVALLIVFSRVKVWTGYSGLGYLIAAHTAFCIPFAYLPIRARLESMDLTLERPPPISTPRRGRRSARHAAAAVARHHRRLHAGLRHLARRRRHHRIREVGRAGYAADLHARAAPARVTPEINAIATVFLAISSCS
jgi:ABC-type spermidine/putrescine transport system permease subunit I